MWKLSRTWVACHCEWGGCQPKPTLRDYSSVLLPPGPTGETELSLHIQGWVCVLSIDLTFYFHEYVHLPSKPRKQAEDSFSHSYVGKKGVGTARSQVFWWVLFPRSTHHRLKSSHWALLKASFLKAVNVINLYNVSMARMWDTHTFKSHSPLGWMALTTSSCKYQLDELLVDPPPGWQRTPPPSPPASGEQQREV